MLSNLWNEQAKDGGGHYVKESSILTCARIKKTQGADLRHGISFDQAAAKARGHLTPLLSLELGVTPRAILGSESEAEHGSSGRVRACLLDAASVAWQRWLLREYLVVSLSG